jgi:D-beta-D-heptose 7-phosphate kinase/D-beta-D-heptose 1-phosphate adenosyltransferase
MTEHKIFKSREDAALWAQKQRKIARKVVFTNGVFDLLHPGHLDSLRRARAEGDVLIVALNDDDSVRALKGPGRPILTLGQRLRLVAALECVDAVVAFPEETPAELVEAIAPDVLVKGGDYAVEDIAGHEFVLARGGRVLSLPLLPGISTSMLVDRIKQRFITPTN